MSAFLTARWRHLVLLTFEAPETLLLSLVPPDCELDRWEERGYVSLVALRLERLRVRGLPVPGLSSYPQVNLRLYLRHEGLPAVRFVRELVPSGLVARFARWRYGEPFVTGRVAARVSEAADHTSVEYLFEFGRASGRIVVRADVEATVPNPETFERWVTQRVRGCRPGADGRVRTFDVSHPPWALHRVESFECVADFAALYGPEWAFLGAAGPVSALLAAGSDVTVSGPG